MRKILLFLGLAALGLALLPAPEVSAQPGMPGRINVTLAADSSVDWANLTCDGQAYGRINRGQTKMVIRRTAQPATVILERDGLREQRSVPAPAGQIVALSVRLGIPVAATGTLSILHSNASYHPWGDCAVDGVNKGRIQRGQALRLTLDANRTYTVTLSHAGSQKSEAARVNPNATTTVILALPAQNGSISVTYDGGSTASTSQVYIDNAYKGLLMRGQTATYQDIPAGQHTVRLQAGALTETKNVIVRAGQAAAVQFRLVPASGAILVMFGANSSFDTADVYIDEAFKGRINRGQLLRFDGIAPGNHVVRLQNGAVQSSANVGVSAGGSVTMVLRLVVTTGSIAVTYDGSSAFPSADVYVDGGFKGRVGRGQTATYAGFGAGQHTVMLQSGGVQQSTAVNVYGGQTATAVLRLAQATGWIQVHYAGSSSFASAVVTIDDQPQGQILKGQTRRFGGITAGVHTVRLDAGEVQESATVSVAGGQTAETVITLRSATGTINVTYAFESGFPFADLYIDGVYKSRINRGQTMSFAGYAAGQHTVLLQSGGVQQSVGAYVRRNQVAPVTVRLQQQLGSISVLHAGNSAYAWADVLIDGAAKGRLARGQQMVYAGYAAGGHEVVLQYGAQRRSTTVQVNPGQVANVALGFARIQSGWLRVALAANSQVTSAQVFLNNTYRGTVQRGKYLQFRLAAGQNYAVRVAQGNQRQQRTVTVNPNRVAQTSFTLGQRTVGTLRMHLEAASAVPYADIYINNLLCLRLYKGQQRVIQLAAGRVYTVEARAPGKMMRRVVTVPAGGVAVTAFRLF